MLAATALTQSVLLLATLLQAVAILYGLVLLGRRGGGTGAWIFLLGAMLSMFAWRVVVTTGRELPAFFNPLIAMWGSTCMLIAMVLFAREIARRASAEAERDALLASERAARADAERAARLKDDFLATLSHELRTPLTAILGWCSILRQGHDGEEQRARAVATIERNARAQARLVDELLDATRIQAGSLHLDCVPVRLDTHVGAAVEAIRPAAAAKGLTLNLRSEGEPVVFADAGRLQQVVSNLLTNAVKFTPAGGTIDVAVTRDVGAALLTVADTGEGIDPAFLPHVFARFRQADSSVARRHGGVGLGLAIASSLARLHGGSITAASDGPGTGATFTLRLPLDDGRTHASNLTEPTAAPQSGRPGELPGTRVLVIDDEPDVRAVVSTLLTQAGAQVTAVASGDGIEQVVAAFQPQLLLIDIGMPGEDGYSLIQRIRRLPESRGGSIPAVSLTAHARNEDRARAMSSGFQAHLPKPIDSELLISTIRRLVPAAPI